MTSTTSIILPHVIMGCTLLGVFQMGGDAAIAQIIPDTTLGNENSVVTPNIFVQGDVSDLIDGGSIRGPNLFHSFEQFNINDSQRVYFANPIGIETILSRVTGNDISDIFGTLGVEGTADLFFLNPNGIIFGPNARLDIRGSFVGTTATQFTFPDGDVFSATTPQAAPLLTVNGPIGLQYGARTLDEDPRILNHGILTTGANLTLAGHHLHLQGQLWSNGDLHLDAQDTLQIREGENTPFIAAARGNMWLRGAQHLDILTLGHPDSGFYSLDNMTLQSSNPISGDAHYWSGGQFRVEKLDGESGHWLSQYDPIIRSQGDVTFANYQGTSLHILSGGSVTVGTVIIRGPDATGNTINPVNTPDLANVELSSGESIVIDGSARPTVDIRAGIRADAIAPPLGTSGVVVPTEAFFTINDDNVILDPSPQNNVVATSANITLDEIIIDDPNGVVLLTNQYTPNVSLPGGDITITGDGLTGFGGIDTRSPDDLGGTIILDARERVQLNPDVNVIAAGRLGGDIQIYADILEMQPNSFLATGVLSGANAVEGRSGDIQVAVRDRLTLMNEAAITNFVLSDHEEVGGDINIESKGSILIDGGSIQSGVGGGLGQGGDIQLRAQTLDLINGTQISNALLRTLGGTSGDISITVEEDITIDDSSVLTSVFPDSIGVAGDLNIQGQRLNLIDGNLFSNVSGSGDSGHIIISTNESVNITASDSNVSIISSWINSDSFGKSGNINISTQTLDLEGGVINSRVDGTGDSGDIILAADHLHINNGSAVISTLYGNGNIGGVNITAEDLVLDASVSKTGIFSSVVTLAGPGGRGKIGDIRINTDSLNVLNGGLISSSSSEQGNSGNIFINVQDDMTLSGITTLSSLNPIISDPSFPDIAFNIFPFFQEISSQITLGSGITTFNVPDSVGDTGNIIIRTGTLNMEDLSALGTSNGGIGNAGNISVTARGAIALDQSLVSSSVASGGQGIGGNITIDGESLTLLNGSQIGAGLNRNQLGRPAAQGEGGTITVRANEFVKIAGMNPEPDLSSFNVISLNLIDSRVTGFFSGLFVAAGSDSIGSAGDIVVTSPLVQLTDAGVITASTQSFQSDAGGDITINADRFESINGGQVNSFTLGPGNAGTIRLNVTDTLRLAGRNSRLEMDDVLFANPSAESGLYVNARAGSTGNSGDIRINGPGLLSITDSGQISAATSGQGTAGSIVIRNVDRVRISNGSISNAIEAEANINEPDPTRGNIIIQTQNLRLNDGATVRSSTAGIGNAGTIRIRDANSISLFDSTITTAVEPDAVGTGGQITLRTDELRLSDRAQITSTTEGDGEAGVIEIGANALLAHQGSRIESRTLSDRSAGDIDLRVRDDIILSGNDSGVFANTSPTSQGEGGNIFIDPVRVILEDGAVIAVDSEGQGQGGDIQLEAGLLRLSDGRILAATDSTDGGNITLRIEDLLLLDNNSQISAEAGRNQGGGDGGNINITAPFVVAIPQENSDIVANAVGGDGGRINISTFRIFGMAERSGTREELQSNQTNDISASSQFGTDGVVAVEDLGVDPVQAVAELPTNTETSPLSQGCQPGADGRGRFVNIERGGIAPAPTDVLDSDWGWEDVAPIQEEGNLDGESMDPQGAIATDTASPNSEATTWSINRQGQVVLHAAESTLTSLNCQL